MFFFNFCIKHAIKEFSATRDSEIKTNGKLFNTVRFADDIVLVAETTQDLVKAGK